MTFLSRHMYFWGYDVWKFIFAFTCLDLRIEVIGVPISRNHSERSGNLAARVLSSSSSSSSNLLHLDSSGKPLAGLLLAFDPIVNSHSQRELGSRKISTKSLVNRWTPAKMTTNTHRKVEHMEPSQHMGESQRSTEEVGGDDSNPLEDRTRLGTLVVPYLGVGTISWGLRGFGGLIAGIERTFLKGSNAVNLAENVVLAAALKGVDFYDTAERYGNSFSTAFGLGYGETEMLVKRTLRESGLDKGWRKPVVATKFTPTPSRTTAQSVVDACEASRQRLGVDVIDLYQIQIPDIVQPWARVPFAPKEWSEPKDEMYWEGMVECYRRGIVANIGVSNYGPKLLRRAYEYFKSKGVPLASNQINYSLLYRKRGAQNTVDVCNELGIKVLAYFPLAMGLLTGKWKSSGTSQTGTWDTIDSLQASGTGIGPVLEPLNPQLTGKSTLEQVDIASLASKSAGLLRVIEMIATRRGKTVPQVALNWIICKGAIPIAGARTSAQVLENSGALGWRLTAEEVNTLEDAADAVDVDFEGAGFKRSNSKFVGYGFETWSLEDED